MTSAVSCSAILLLKSLSVYSSTSCSLANVELTAINTNIAFKYIVSKKSNYYSRLQQTPVKQTNCKRRPTIGCQDLRHFYVAQLMRKRL